MRATVPLDVEQTVIRALAKVPADRFRNAAEFAAALSAPRTSTVASSFGVAPRVRRRTIALAAAHDSRGTPVAVYVDQLLRKANARP